MKTLSQKMSLENRIKLENNNTEISKFLIESLDEKNSWLDLTIKDVYYLEIIFGLKLDVVEINEFFKY